MEPPVDHVAELESAELPTNPATTAEEVNRFAGH